MRATLATLALLMFAPLLRADVVVFVNGDRITGRVLGKITRRVRLQTPYGVLVIPADKIERIRRSDGNEEVLNFVPPPAPPPPPPPPPAALMVVVTGHSFWQAWDPKSAPQDPSLRLEVRLDDQVVAAYTDVNLDPEDLPKAVVNSFVFSPDRLFVSSRGGATASAPELVPGEIHLLIVLPEGTSGSHRLRIAYQVNEAGSAAPEWRDVVEADGEVVLAPGAVSRVRVLQDRGTMEFTRHRMRNVESFRATLSTSAP
jgi:hypothetical protein